MPRWLAHAIVVAVFAAALAVAFARVNYEWNWAGVWEYRQKFLQGWLVTVGISLTALVTSTLIGGGVAALLRSGNVLLEAAGRVYVELIRGTPLLVQLLIGFYVVAAAVGLAAGLQPSPHAFPAHGARNVPRSSSVLMKDWSRRAVSRVH